MSAMDIAYLFTELKFQLINLYVICYYDIGVSNKNQVHLKLTRSNNKPKHFKGPLESFGRIDVKLIATKLARSV